MRPRGAKLAFSGDQTWDTRGKNCDSLNFAPREGDSAISSSLAIDDNFANHLFRVRIREEGVPFRCRSISFSRGHRNASFDAELGPLSARKHVPRKL